MALNIPMPESGGSSLLQGLNTGSTLFSRMIQPVIERERLKQQQNQFMQNYVLRNQAEARANALLPYMIQQYQDSHRTAASEAQMKDMYRSLIQNALNGSDRTPSAQSAGSSQSDVPQVEIPSKIGNIPQINQGLPGNEQQTPQVSQTAIPMTPTSQNMMTQEHELRAGNSRLAKLDSIAGLVPGIPKPTQHIQNGMVFTTYPSGRMTVQQTPGVKTQGERNVSAKEASKIRDQATALINSANLVQQGYELLDNNPDLTGPGNFLSAIPIPFSGGSKINLSNNPELGKFTTITGKLQAELARYAASNKGGIQTIKWVGNVKPSSFNPEKYNYGMFEGIQKNIEDDYDTLNQQYRAATGENLPIKLPKMNRKKGENKSAETETKTSTETGTNRSKKVKKIWKLVNGELV